MSLVNGQLVYSATGSMLLQMPANDKQTDSFGFTISDQYGDTAIGRAKITVDHHVDVINGPGTGYAPSKPARMTRSSNSTAPITR